MLPAKFAFLAREPGPKMLVELLKLVGTIEAPKERDNPVILGWARELGLAGYVHDSIAWCGLTMAIGAKRAGWPVVKDPLWALNWRNFGVRVAAPMLADVMVKKREGGGHVTMYVAEDATDYFCLGGNQGDAVSIVAYPKSTPFTFHRPLYRAQPANVRVVRLAAGGAARAGSEA